MKECDRGATPLRERRRRDARGPLRSRGDFRVCSGRFEGEREESGRPGAAGRHHVGPDALFVGCVDERRRFERGGNREHPLPARGIGHVPPAHEDRELGMAATLRPPGEIGRRRLPGLVELLLRDQLGGRKLSSSQAGHDHDHRSPAGCGHRPCPLHRSAAPADEQIPERGHAVDRIDEHVPRIVRFEQPEPPGSAGSDERESESIAGEHEHGPRHGSGRHDTRLTPAECIGIEAAQPQGCGIEQQRRAGSPPHGRPPRGRIEPRPGEKGHGHEVDEHDQKGDRKRLPEPVEPATERHAGHRHEHGAAERERQPARNVPRHGERHGPHERCNRHAPRHDRIPPGRIIHATGSRPCARSQASFITTCRTRRIFHV